MNTFTFLVRTHFMPFEEQKIMQFQTFQDAHNWSPSYTTSTSNTKASTVGMSCLFVEMFFVSTIPFESY